MNKHSLVYIVVILFTLLFGGCDKNELKKIIPEIYVNKTSISGFIGQEIQLTASPTNGKYTFQWTSDDEGVAYVTSKGLVKLLSEGATTILLSVGEAKQRIEVNSIVRIPIVDIVLSDLSIELPVQARKNIIANFLPDNANDIPKAVWSSENIEVAVVNDEGEITAVGQGTTSIVVKAGNLVKKVKVTVPFYSEEVAAIINKSGLVASVTSHTYSSIYDGVSYSSLNFKKTNGEPLSVFVVKTDLSNKNISLSTLMPDNKTTYGLQTVELMAQARHSSGQTVLAAINADFFTSGGIPLGPVFMNGNILKTTQSNVDVNYFAVRKDNTPVIGRWVHVPSSEYGNFRDVVGAGVNMLVTNGVPSNYGTTDKEPRTVIGYDKNLVYMVVVDGRRAATSVGATLDQLGLIMSALGCSQAVNLDGGGSSTMVLKNVGDDSFKTVNAYSDANPRKVANAIGLTVR